jgi:hypothetical protein
MLPIVPHPDQTMGVNKKVLADLLACLAAIDSTHVLIGGLAAGYYGKPRATVDVDMLVPRQAAESLPAELERRGYRVDVSRDMLRVYRRGSKQAVADLVWREAHPALEAASAHVTRALVLGLRVNLVKRGAFVALKWHAAISPRRGRTDQQQDVVDIMRVLDKKFVPADEALAVAIAERSYPGGGRNLAEMLDDIRNARPVKV